MKWCDSLCEKCFGNDFLCNDSTFTAADVFARWGIANDIPLAGLAAGTYNITVNGMIPAPSAILLLGSGLHGRWRITKKFRK